MRRMYAFLFSLVSLCSHLYGQSPAIIGSSYGYPSGITVAPGQIDTFFVAGLKNPSAPILASFFPLPTTPGGVSVTIDQAGLALGHISYAVPLLEVQPTFSGLTAVTAVTVQIPFEVRLTSHCPAGGSSMMCPATATVTQNGIASQSFSITIQRDNIHILNTCDHYPSAGLPLIGCYPIVTHPDGSLVSAMAPAAAGEEIVLYAFGLGATDPVVNTGDAAPLPAHVLANKHWSTFNSTFA